MTEAERIELKGAMCRIARLVLDIDARMEPSLHDRVEALKAKGYTDDELQEVYDRYLEDLAEECVKRVEWNYADGERRHTNAGTPTEGNA